MWTSSKTHFRPEWSLESNLDCIFFFYENWTFNTLFGFALISPELPKNYLGGCFSLSFLWLYICHSRQTEWSVGPRLVNKNPNVVISGPDQTHLPLQIWSEVCGETSSSVFFFLTKCPSAALRAELWMSVGWWRLEGANDSYMIAFLSFLLSCTKWPFQRGKSPSSGHRVKRRQLVWLNALITFCLRRFFRFLSLFLWSFFYVLHTKRRYMFTAPFLDF